MRRSEEIEKLENEDMKAFLRQIPPMKGSGFSELLPHADPVAVELLTKMLQFGRRRCGGRFVDPSKRITPAEALDSPYFRGIRSDELEVGKIRHCDV